MKTPARKWLSLAAEREALKRMEEAARTVEEYDKVIEQWDHIDENRERRERDHEIGRADEAMLYWTQGRDGEMQVEFTEYAGIVPCPLGHEYWRQLLRGDFLDFIHDCPFEMHEITTSMPLFDLLQTLNANQLEVLYYAAIRQESPQRVAKRRGQTDRNILKVYATLIGKLRQKMYERLAPRYDAKQPLTYAQKCFVEDYRAGKLIARWPRNPGQKKKGKKKRRD